jgi:hypothetical protein
MSLPATRCRAASTAVRIRRLAVRADATLTLAPVVFWAAVISVANVTGHARPHCALTAESLGLAEKPVGFAAPSITTRSPTHRHDYCGSQSR